MVQNADGNLEGCECRCNAAQGFHRPEAGGPTNPGAPGTVRCADAALWRRVGLGGSGHGFRLSLSSAPATTHSGTQRGSTDRHTTAPGSTFFPAAESRPICRPLDVNASTAGPRHLTTTECCPNNLTKHSPVPRFDRGHVYEDPRCCYLAAPPDLATPGLTRRL